MPYMVENNDGNYDVYKKGPDGGKTGKRLGRHKTAKDARAQISAINISEHSKALGVDEEALEAMDKGLTKFTQAETNYTVLSLTPGQACVNCRWFNSWGHSCNLVESWYPESIEPTGWCTQWDAVPVRAPEPIPVIVVESKDLEEAEEEEKGVLKTLKTILFDIFIGRKDGAEEPIVGFKALDDGTWFGIFSNNFQDKAREIIALKAWEEYAEKVNSGQKSYPALDFWHIDGTEVQGTATDLGVAGNFMWAKGVFNDNEQGRKWKEYYQNNGPWGMSHEFWFPKSKKSAEGVYWEIRSLDKVSVLPPTAAANEYTYFEGELDMPPVSQTQREHLVKALGSELGNKIADKATTKGAQLEDVVASKSMDADTAAMVKGLADDQALLAEAVVKMSDQFAAASAGNVPLATQVKHMADSVAALTTKVTEFMGMESPASKSDRTQLSDDSTSPQLQLLKKKNDEGVTQKSILEQILEGQTQFNLQTGSPAAPPETEGL